MITSLIIQELLVHEKMHLFFNGKKWKSWKISLQNYSKCAEHELQIFVFFEACGMSLLYL